ncbi:MAG: PQQ-binding-like beta-propeller repeat protein [Opitutae bacterium]|jgi:Tat protein translocase TatC|nr:PQQ-binding-like beta-propeller repeat protein [Opitutae bacterium]MBT5691903.1 PQQ-binding-like beta-propeller repeat protein [Opitutae bacterium]MBT6462005.1 PQQ-binding-like beta-propeller repeat protein [Opitutae bacterium]MBT6959246.1 PQQ-binding-like beta-propeller repeat protein [Opitutae bacterium]MBT7854756.1 PQQ-binding-like beta-propeller repeat protein [Opitutae bacterium]
MAEDSQTSDTPDNSETNNSGQESASQDEPVNIHNKGPELDLSSSGRIRNQANLPRKSADKDKPTENVEGSSPEPESTADNGEDSYESDPSYDDHHHDDYHDPDHYDDDYHHDQPQDEGDDWWEEDEKDEEDQLSDAGEMSFLDHLEDLRWTLFKSVGAFLIGCIVVGINLKLFADLLQSPIDHISATGSSLVYTLSGDQTLQALERSTGEKKWEVDVQFQPVIDSEGTLFAVTPDQKIIALNGSTGKEKWEFKTDGAVRAPPSLDTKGILYIGTQDSKVYAINAKTGKKKWEFEASGAVDDSPLLSSDENIELRTRQPLGVLMVLMQVVLFGGLAVSLPFIIMAISGFVAPGLTKREKRMLLPGSIAAVFLFLAGAALAFFFIIPVSLKFSALLNDWMNIELLWDVNDYYSLVVMVTLAIGALFQFPLLLVITGYLGILPSSKLRKGRKLVFVIILIVAALLTPGDVIVALVLLTIPLYALFEGSILMVAYVERGKARRQARVEERRKKRELDRETAKQKADTTLTKNNPEDNSKSEKDR